MSKTITNRQLLEAIEYNKATAEVTKSDLLTAIRLNKKAIESTGEEVEEIKTGLLGKINEVQTGLLGKINEVQTGLLGKIDEVQTGLLGKINEVQTNLSGEMQLLTQTVQDFANNTEQRLGNLESDMTAVKSTMITKSYLDDRLSDLKADMTELVYKEDKKLMVLVNETEDGRPLTKRAANNIRKMAPFSKIKNS